MLPIVCSLGAPLLAGADTVNLIKSQYGIASLKFRWNLCGFYQQVIPRYVSIDERTLANAVFLKGYAWLFEPEKLYFYFLFTFYPFHIFTHGGIIY